MRTKDREHHTQVLLGELSRAFAMARDAASIDRDNLRPSTRSGARVAHH